MNIVICVKLILLVIVSLLMLIFIANMISYLQSFLDKKIAFKRHELIFNMSKDIYYLDFLDRMISEYIGRYILYNITGANITYIPDKEQQQMIHEVLKQVLDDISPEYLSALSYIYNKDRLNDIICERVALQVIDVCIDFNSGSDNTKK